ncbi:IS481 family transposase [Pseudoxanthomonas suwonensis]|uniref:IS481 family transposase n=1 Tax=Pseudoxanthomonas suwonensis TaxID=314722 RepID=UPI000465FA7B|nr:IS481 family transposase [Pseudoxanthomonas suwonensis]
MSASSQRTKRKLSLLQLAEELGNVSKACQLMGYHRDSFYEIKRAFQTGGVAALVEQRRGPRGPHPNRVPPEVEQAILDFCLAHPTKGSQFVANQLRLQGVQVGQSGVRGVWQRHDMLTRHKRLLRLEAQARHTTFVLSDEQMRLLERAGSDVLPQHVESNAPGELLNQDTFYWGTLKGVGKAYVQVVVDTFCSLAFAKVYTSKMPVTAADTLFDRVLPFYEAIGVPMQAMLTDNGREFCGKPDSHPYELLLAMENIEHRTTKIATPRTNGFVERMNRTLLDECFRVAGRQTWYITPDEIQRDLDVFLRYYNLERSHQGYRLKGRTPAKALREALQIDALPPIVPDPEETTETEAEKLVA